MTARKRGAVIAAAALLAALGGVATYDAQVGSGRRPSRPTGGAAVPPGAHSKGSIPPASADQQNSAPRFVAARSRLHERWEVGGLNAWFEQEVSEALEIADPHERAARLRALDAERTQRANAVWEEGHIEPAAETAVTVRKLRFEVARRTGEPPAAAFPFEVTLTRNCAEYVSGREHFMEPMQEAAAYCSAFLDAGGRLGELAKSCVGATSGY